MAFTNQFALTLEVTRLLPPVKWATSKVANAIIARARDLRQSGSDIVIEEDLVNVFGRCRISSQLTSSFKTIVTKKASDVSLLEGIVIQGGPGPTVVRALQETPYMSMVVQISFLAWTFNTRYLATAIADALRKRMEGAPLSLGLPSSPDRMGILGVLQACESQTSAFNWNMMLDAVSTTLGHQKDESPIELPHFMFQGLPDMLPMVQTLPNDRFIHIQIPIAKDRDLRMGNPITPLVVWAHHILDLTVKIRRPNDGGKLDQSYKFGSSPMEQLFIDEVKENDEAFITLLDSQREHLLTIKPEPDVEHDLIGSIKRVPARGLGNFSLTDELGYLDSFDVRSPAIIEDLQAVTTAFAFLVAKKLVKEDTMKDVNENAEESINLGNLMTYRVDSDRLIRASRFLFDNPRIYYGKIESLVQLYASKPLNESLPRPAAFDAAQRAFEITENRDVIIQDHWNITCTQAVALSILLIALASIINLDDCEELMIAGLHTSDLLEHPLIKQIFEWNGQDHLRFSDAAWLQALAVPLLGHHTYVWNMPWHKICLISDRGWSAWITTLGDVDPTGISADSVRVGRGSPCRNGVWKSGIWDSDQGGHEFWEDPWKAEGCGGVASLHCAERVSLDRPYVGEGEDVFLVCARFRFSRNINNQNSIQRAGYKALQRCLWRAQVSKRCPHSSRTSEEITLGVGCATFGGFGNYLKADDERILIHLTAHSKGARWLALRTAPFLSICDSDNLYEDEPRQVLLRGNDCCLQCVIDQAASQRGEWLVIL